MSSCSILVNPLVQWRYSRLSECSAVLLYLALVSYFWWPSLWDGQLIIHADSAHHGLSLLQMLQQWLQGSRETLLWSSDIYGGHPLFAESQGGFLNPLNLLAALLFEPLYGVGVLHWADMLLAGYGVYALCRVIHLSPWAALFASIAVSYSTVWIAVQYNTSVAGSLVWTTWTLAAAQYWLNRPSALRAVLMAIPATLLVYSGYPHLAHGVAIYLAGQLLALLLIAEGRALLSQRFRALLLTGIGAVVLALLLSAVQLLPLVELVTQSGRNAGTAMPFAGMLSAGSYISGMLFFDWSLVPKHLIVGSQGSLLVCLLALLGVCLRMPVFIVGHAMGGFLLMNLGMEYASPLFTLAYDYHLIPGLHGYRAMHPFFLVGVVGLAVLAAHALTCLARRDWPVFGWLPRWMTGRRWVALVTVVVLVGSYGFFPEGYSRLNYAFVLVLLATVLGLALASREHLIPLAAALVILADALFVRSDLFGFHEPESVAQAGVIGAILQDPDHRLYRTATKNGAGGSHVFASPIDKDLAGKYRQYLESLSPFPGVVDGVASIDGVLALALERRTVLESHIEAELKGTSTSQPSQRVIDQLGLRYIAFQGQPAATGLGLYYEDSGSQVYRNEFALSKYRVYTSAEARKDARQVLSAMTEGDPQVLYVEASVSEPAVACRQGDSPQVQWREQSDLRYVAEINSACMGWLYVADAYYPGWQARVDGQKVDLYPAQVLGKAVRFPAGNSVVEIEYRPLSFYISAVLSGFAWLVVLAWLGFAAVTIRRRKIGDQGESCVA